MADYTVLVACDLNGKCNFELTFACRPTIPELRERLEEDIGAEAQLRRGTSQGPFQISRAQVFDEKLEMWVDLVSPDQLENFCQVYVFQRDHRDTPGRIPPPIKPLPLRHGARSHHHPTQQHQHHQHHHHHHHHHHHQPHHHHHHHPPPIPHAPPPPGALYADPAPRYPSGSAFYPPPEPHQYAPSEPHSPGAAHSDAGAAAAEPAGAPGRGRHLPELPAHADKVLLVFQELDLRRSRSISQEDWRTVFERLRLCGSDDGRSPFSEETASDLFARAAGDGSDSVSFHAFQPFAEVYPKLLDALYYRSRDWYHDEALREKTKQEKDKCERLERKLEESRDGSAGAGADKDQRQQQVEDAAAEVQAAKDREQDALRDKQDAAAATEAARAEVAGAKREQQGIKEQARRKDADKRNCERAVASAEKNLRQRQDEHEKAVREKERLLRALENQEKDIQRKADEVVKAEADVSAAQDKVRGAEDPALEREIQDRADRVASAEAALRQAADDEAQRTRALKDAQRSVQQAQQQKQSAEKEAAVARSKEAQRRQLEERAERALDEQRQLVEKLEQSELDADDERRKQESTEAELLQMEARLREQREAVERKEMQLRSAHRDFSAGYGRVSPPRGRTQTA